MKTAKNPVVQGFWSSSVFGKHFGPLRLSLKERRNQGVFNADGRGSDCGGGDTAMGRDILFFMKTVEFVATHDCE